MTSRTLLVVALTAGALVLGPSASAQVPPGQGPPPGQGSPPGQGALPVPPDTQKPLGPAEVQAIIDGYVVIQAQRALNLTDAQFAQFVVRVRPMQEARRRNQRLHNQLIQELARLTNPANTTVDEAQLREKLKALDDLDQKSAADLKKAYENIDQILDVRQQARLREFHDQDERRMLDLL